MNMQKFVAGLERLLSECGAELSENIEITASQPASEGFIGIGMDSDSCQAVRERQPMEIKIIAKVSAAGKWHHRSGDDRRLHPDLS